MKFPKHGQGPAKPVNDSSVEKLRDNVGFTNPNLHRRIDSTLEPVQVESGEQLARSYSLGIATVDSYRTTTVNTHDEDSIYVEIP